MSDLTVGERGFIFDHGDYWPARVLATDVVQTFGPFDQIVAYKKYEGHEFITRLVRGNDACTGKSWVSTARFAEIEREKICKEAEALQARAEALSELV